jgi:2-C-methyl-D-erythritol 4-phosphate cytidylyltransferase
MISALILAGGKGKRMQSDVSKQFIIINGKPLLYYTIMRFIKCDLIDKIVLVLPKDEVEYCEKNIVQRYSLKVDMIVEGGKERQDSVRNGLNALIDTDIVLIHDGARAFVSEEIINDGIKYAKLYGAAAPGVIPKDTIKVRDHASFSKETLNRDELVAIQTPQVFKMQIIKECHDKIKKDKIVVTDDTMVVEIYGHKVYLFKGDYSNLKVTTPEDLIMAEYLSKSC